MIERSLIRANVHRAVDGTEFEVGMAVAVGDDDWGVVPAEVVELDRESGSMVVRLIGELVDEHA